MGHNTAEWHWSRRCRARGVRGEVLVKQCFLPVNSVRVPLVTDEHYGEEIAPPRALALPGALKWTRVDGGNPHLPLMASMYRHLF